ncbi:DUF3667 domain-containing protein [Mucilaginibacter gilvus]|uniref:DUF3667 domain-containing protein n=1 Tax=Mucilaginibacter gilvus TaxID=2305909 RepID=UPI001419BEAC|nr:DUF3667 domain-containing protein [Mucilaginibacter gilvus]
MNKKINKTHSELAAPGLCASCGTVVNDKFCGTCGEKQVDAHDFALKHYVEESVEGITHFDNKFFRTAKTLITKPGLLTADFSKGKRITYLKPFQLFITCNILFFFLAGSLNIFSQPLYSFYAYDPYVSFHTKETILQKAHNDAEFTTLAATFNGKVGTESKLYIALFIPTLALVFALIFFNTKRYFTEHLVFATHYFSFILIYFTLFTLLVIKPFYWFTHLEFSSTFDTITSVINMAVFGTYFTIAAKRFYKVGGYHAFSGAVITTVMFVGILTGYRLLIFYKLMWTMH